MLLVFSHVAVHACELFAGKLLAQDEEQIFQLLVFSARDHQMLTVTQATHDVFVMSSYINSLESQYSILHLRCERGRALFAIHCTS